MHKTGFCCILVILIACNQKSHKNGLVSDSTHTIQESSVIFDRYPLITWLRKTPVEIGCMLEKELIYRDSIFNCDSKNYINMGDPCVNTDLYYEGIVLTENLAQNLHPQIKAMDLEFEHGSLRQIHITFRDSLSITNLNRIFRLPNDKSKYPENILSIEYGENLISNSKPVNINFTKWLTITGFEHIGSGEAGCD